ncbi:unnamed protein product [Owenia fusiformis]|uniref:Uncharacterized protein n=1 Tax=Owenia fusiformis TaxID=6347 RepID=A0A8J1ULE6_OWEFU|nr:unnamed protein product [Owenia fusiformis]
MILQIHFLFSDKVIVILSIAAIVVVALNVYFAHKQNDQYVETTKNTKPKTVDQPPTIQVSSIQGNEKADDRTEINHNNNKRKHRAIKEKFPPYFPEKPDKVQGNQFDNKYIVIQNGFEYVNGNPEGNHGDGYDYPDEREDFGLSGYDFNGGLQEQIDLLQNYPDMRRRHNQPQNYLFLKNNLRNQHKSENRNEPKSGFKN